MSRDPFLLVLRTVPSSSTRLCYSKHTAEDTEMQECHQCESLQRGWSCGPGGWPTWLSINKYWSWGKTLTTICCNTWVKPGFREGVWSLLSGDCTGNLKFFPVFFFLCWPLRPLYPLLEEGKWHKTTWIQVFPHQQHSSYAARSLCRAEPWPQLCFVTCHSAPTHSVFPLQHLPLVTDK